ncbi:MAG: 1-(5-phosphoribosyl)-5-[(5-phosphoribosylamino)methylideneamino]imidazole-4-carboxamide isomerase [Gemmatales bacterium]|nr:1-(5-phosphoribosyl)-5-[(5-phosphoribosylamino)methylideneamino]imidazole-4-carboxamide isomerase [Gemmatales bacterium]MDW8387423.1 1-(5-phosphoribosyl)-5-[(5-phosphoribosylamino)methylideneamino]imidazole-4-carboxamide isomerase [Gemmatales bacterium]
MLIIPAIDIRGGRCVRLVQGDYDRETVFDVDPAAAARRWIAQGATWLHLVDLDGARTGRIVNSEAIAAITGEVSVPCQLGGGIRSEADLEQAWRLGVARVVIGTQAIKKPEWFADVAARYPGRLLLGLDAREGMAAAEGWREVSSCSVFDLARRFAGLPLAGVIFTDISRDGMLTGPNYDAMRRMVQAVGLPVIASGGVSALDDLERLVETGVAGCIVGRALYEGKFTLEEAIRRLNRGR